MWSVAADNDETQRKGVVLVAWPRISESKARVSKFIPPTSAPSWWKNFLESIPIRVCAIHLCNNKLGPFLKIVFSAIGSVLIKQRIRMKVHTGMFCIVLYCIAFIIIIIIYTAFSAFIGTVLFLFLLPLLLGSDLLQSLPVGLFQPLFPPLHRLIYCSYCTS